MKELIKRIREVGYRIVKIKPSKKHSYTYNGIDIVILFKEALRLDPTFDQDDMETYIKIPMWLKGFSLIDEYTDEERSLAKKALFSKYPYIKTIFDQNKLRASQLRVIHKLLDMEKETFFTDPDLKELWYRHIKTIETNKNVSIKEGDAAKSHYEIIFDLKARQDYMFRMSMFLREICVHYIESKLLK